MNIISNEKIDEKELENARKIIIELQKELSEKIKDGYGPFLAAIYDEKGNWHGLYAMAFKDSNYHMETMIGYAYQKNWNLCCSDDWKVGLGYTLGFTQRHEYAYIPVPLPLPIVGIEYTRLALQMAYVPGWTNMGNVAFFWLRFNLD